MIVQQDIKTEEEFEKQISENSAAAFYFSTPDCNVCKILKPKLIDLLNSDFPEFKFFYIDCEKAEKLAAQKNIFAVPTILFYFEGKEFIRKSRNINLSELSAEISRPYSMLF